MLIIITSIIGIGLLLIGIILNDFFYVCAGSTVIILAILHLFSNQIDTLLTLLKEKRQNIEQVNAMIINHKGYNRLWRWFSLSHASWLTLPRIMMHEMPDEWQDKMAALLEEWDETWDSNDMPTPSVSAKKDGKYTRWPDWLLNYRHPNKQEIKKLRIKENKNDKQQ